MSSIQRRVKNVQPVPLIHITEPISSSSTNATDPRSPTTNIIRSPVDLQTYQLPSVINPKMNMK
jgi:hypothetical protein